MDLDRLKEIPLFGSIEESALRGIAPFVAESTVPAGEEIIREGDFAYELIAIQEGEAAVVRDGETIATLGPGDVFGEIALLDKSLRSASVVARTPMRIVSLSRWHLRRIGSAIDAIRETAQERRRYLDRVQARAAHASLG